MLFQIDSLKEFLALDWEQIGRDDSPSLACLKDVPGMPVSRCSVLVCGDLGRVSHEVLVDGEVKLLGWLSFPVSVPVTNNLHRGE